MSRWQKFADLMAELHERGEIEIFGGDTSLGFEVGVDADGVYVTLCPHCVGEAVNIALGGDPEGPPEDHGDLH